MTMIDFICWLQKEKEELEEMLDAYDYEHEIENKDEEWLIKQGRLEEVKRILRKLTRSGVV